MNNNIPVIDLAQLLTGALDENFNVSKKKMKWEFEREEFIEKK